MLASSSSAVRAYARLQRSLLAAAQAPTSAPRCAALCGPTNGLARQRFAQQQRIGTAQFATKATSAAQQPASASENAAHKPKPAKVKRKPTSRHKKAGSAVAGSTEKLHAPAKKGGKPVQRKPRSKKQTEEEMLALAAKGELEQGAVASGNGSDEQNKAKSQKSASKKSSTEKKDVAAASAVGTEAEKAEKKAETEEKSAQTAVVTTKKAGAMTRFDKRTQKITMTLEEIQSLQKTLPSANEIAEMVNKLRSESFEKAHTLFDLYRNYGNPYLDENFLTPGVMACCEAKNPAEGIRIVRDMLSQGRKVDEVTLRALFDACDETSSAREVIELWDLMVLAGMELKLEDYNRFLDICYRREYLDGAIKVLKQLRLLRPVSVHTYMHWLLRSSIVWRSDAFFDILMEMRLSGVEPEIKSLTSLESGRQDRALTVMEGVRAVGLDPCFAMSSVFSSMQSSLYQNGPSYTALSSKDIKEAKKKFGDLKPQELDWPVNPIPQVLETQAAGLILQQETFRRLKRKQVNHIDELLQLLPITANMTINLRKQLLRMSLLVNTHRVRRDTPQIVQEYDSGRSLIELSTVHNYPPVSLLRIILKARGMNQLSIKHALNNPGERLDKRGQYELRKAIEYDSIHKSDPFIGAPKYNADSLERAIEHFIKSKGIRMKTQEELCAEQVETHGRRVISPDILLLDPVIINGTPIRWIDAKNYYGAHIVSKRLISKQLANYVKEWGPGAIVFGMGYSDMFSVPGVICLDTTPFPKTRKEMAKMRLKSFFYSCANVFRWKKHLGSKLTQEYPIATKDTNTSRSSDGDSDNGSFRGDGNRSKDKKAAESSTSTSSSTKPSKKD